MNQTAPQTPRKKRKSIRRILSRIADALDLFGVAVTLETEIAGTHDEPAPTPPPPIEVPEGFRLLEAGPTRYVRVNRGWISELRGERPFLVRTENGSYRQFSEVRILGGCFLNSAENAEYVCGVASRGAWVETTGPILVKD